MTIVDIIVSAVFSKNWDATIKSAITLKQGQVGYDEVKEIKGELGRAELSKYFQLPVFK